MLCIARYVKPAMRRRACGCSCGQLRLCVVAVWVLLAIIMPKELCTSLPTGDGRSSTGMKNSRRPWIEKIPVESGPPSVDPTSPRPRGWVSLALRSRGGDGNVDPYQRHNAVQGRVPFSQPQPPRNLAGDDSSLPSSQAREMEQYCEDVDDYESDLESDSYGAESEDVTHFHDLDDDTTENYDTDEEETGSEDYQEDNEDQMLAEKIGGDEYHHKHEYPPAMCSMVEHEHEEKPFSIAQDVGLDGVRKGDTRSDRKVVAQPGTAVGDSIRVSVMTWNLAEASPPPEDMEFLRRVAYESDLVAVGVQEIENLKPRRHEGSRTREWRRLLSRTLGRDYVRVAHRAMGAVQLTLFARRGVVNRVKVIKFSEVACGVGNVLQNKGGIGAFVRVDRTTFLFVTAHLAAHQGKVEERNADYWRIVNTLEQEIPPAWITHAARKRARRYLSEGVATPARVDITTAERPGDPSGAVISDNGHAGQHTYAARPGGSAKAYPQTVFGGCVDRIFFFGDLNYRIDLSREDLELGLSAAKMKTPWGAEKSRYPGLSALDSLLDFDQLTLVRAQGKAFKGFSEGRLTFEPTYKYDKGSERLDTSKKMRPPAWTDRILHSPGGPLSISSLEYSSVPNARHSDHRPVYATFRVQLADG